MTRQPREPMAAHEWIARATELLNRDPAATARRLELIPAALDAAAARAARLAPGPVEPADAAELAARLERIGRTVATWHRLRDLHPAMAEILESTRPAIEAAERLIAAARTNASQ